MIYLICLLMCVISVFSKKEHKVPTVVFYLNPEQPLIYCCFKNTGFILFSYSSELVLTSCKCPSSRKKLFVSPYARRNVFAVLSIMTKNYPACSSFTIGKCTNTAAPYPHTDLENMRRLARPQGMLNSLHHGSRLQVCKGSHRLIALT